MTTATDILISEIATRLGCEGGGQCPPYKSIMNEPLHDLLRDALGLMHRAFYDPAKPQTLACEFYHQFRKLWDKGAPVGYGLGHLIIAPLDPVSFAIRRMSEAGQPGDDLATIHFEPPEAAPPGFRHTLVVTNGLKLQRYE